MKLIGWWVPNYLLATTTWETMIAWNSQPNLSFQKEHHLQQSCTLSPVNTPTASIHQGNLTCVNKRNINDSDLCFGIHRCFFFFLTAVIWTAIQSVVKSDVVSSSVLFMHLTVVVKTYFWNFFRQAQTRILRH